MSDNLDFDYDSNDVLDTSASSPEQVYNMSPAAMQPQTTDAGPEAPPWSAYNLADHFNDGSSGSANRSQSSDGDQATVAPYLPRQQGVDSTSAGTLTGPTTALADTPTYMAGKPDDAVAPFRGMAYNVAPEDMTATLDALPKIANRDYIGNRLGNDLNNGTLEETAKQNNSLGKAAQRLLARIDERAPATPAAQPSPDTAMPGAPTANADSASTSSASDARAEPAAGDKRGYTDDVYAQLVDAFGRADGVSSSGSTGGMMFAGPGAPSSDFQLPTVFVTPDSAKLHPQFVTPEGASTGLAYGPGYNGALSGLTVAPAGFGNDVDLNAAAFRVPTTGTGKSSWDALTQQADARIADGTYDRFSDMGHAITDPGSFGDRLKRLAHAATYTRPDADEQTAAALSPPPMSTGDAAIDSMRSSPFAGMAGGIAYELGGTDTDALYASQAAGSLGGVAASVAGYQLPKALQAESRASVSRSNAKVRVAPVDVGTLEEPAGSADNARQTNPPKAESPIWRGFKNAKNGVKTDGTRLFQWDHDHDDIEVYNKRLVHMGSMDPVTGLIYKPPVPGRRLKNW